MKKTALFMANFLLLCGIGVAESAIADNKPELYIVARDGGKFLSDDSGKLLYSLAPPRVSIDLDNNVARISPNVSYAPGTDYCGSSYDGFTVFCGGGLQSRTPVKEFKFGPSAGDFDIPVLPYESCSINAFVVDGKGTTFKTDTQNIFFSRKN